METAVLQLHTEQDESKENERSRSDCWTGRTAKPLYRLLLFDGLTPPELKFRFRALRAELNVEDQ